MKKGGPAGKEGIKVIATNRRARYDFHIEDNYETGISLTGSEVRS